MRANRLSIFGSAALLLAGAAFLAGSARAKSEGEAPPPAPQTKNGGPIVRFTATTENISDARDSIRIDLIGWSSDADRTALPKAWNDALTRQAAIAAAKAKGTSAQVNATPKAAAAPAAANGRPVAPAATPKPLTPRSSLYAALEKGPTLGYVWSGREVSGYTIKYAVKEPEAGGGQRVVLITDRKLGDTTGSWDFTGPAAATFKNEVVTVSPNSDEGSDLGGNQYDEFSIIELHLNSRGEGEGKISAAYKIAVDPSTNQIELLNYKELPVVLANIRRHEDNSDKKS